MATNKWVPIVVGVVIFVVLVGAGLIGGVAYTVARRVQVQEMTASGGQEEFDKLVSTMAGQKPFIEMEGDNIETTVVHRELATKDTGSVSTVRVRIWSPRDRQLIRVDLPFWLVRLTGSNSIHLNAGTRTGVRLRVTPEDIDRRGPGLILSHTMPSGERVLVWTE
jgi:hypothetical protein